MLRENLDAIVSSRTRLTIADLVSSRPRSLSELSEKTGISVQGVFKHLRALEEMGFVEERDVGGKGTEMRVRKVFAPKSEIVRDFSTEGLVLVKVSPVRPKGKQSRTEGESLESAAEELTLLRARVREQSRRLIRAIDELLEEEGRLADALEYSELKGSEKILAAALFGEEDPEQASRVLLRNYGLKRGRRSIDKALAEANKIGKK